jgi:hypothetical protein
VILPSSSYRRDVSDARWMELAREQNKLHGDVTMVAEYGRAHEDEWGGLRMVNEPTVVIEAAFTDHVDHHRATLSRMLTYPARLQVVPARYTESELTAILDETLAWLQDKHPGALSTAGKGWAAVEVHLEPTATAVAQELRDRYGDALGLTVGTKPFPPRPDVVPTGPRPLPDAPADVNGVHAEIILEDNVVPSGTTVRGQIAFHNHGDQPATIHGGQMVGSVVRLGTDEIVGVYVGAVLAFGLTVSMSPGEDGWLPLLVGTASVIPNSDPVLPPGDYEAVAVVKLSASDVLVARTALSLT